MVRMFENAKEHIRNRILDQAKSSLQRVMVYGTADLAQLVFHALERSGIRILGVCTDDAERIGSEFCGREVVNASQIRFMAPDAVILADSKITDIPANLSALSQYGIELLVLDTGRNQGPAASLRHKSEKSSFWGSRNRDKINLRESASTR